LVVDSITSGSVSRVYLSMTFFANVSSDVILKLPVQNENGAVSSAGE
jgi:hypothetical protein